MEYIHPFIIVNGNKVTNIIINNQGNTSIYEVIRIEECVPLFLESHFQRLYNSAIILNKKIPFLYSEFKEFIEQLVELNKVCEGNIKITIEYLSDPEPIQYSIGFILHKYPTEEEYRHGVKTLSSINRRFNPNAKVQNDTLRNELNNLMQSHRAYEAILVHPEGYITEGSRSNIFFIKGKTIFTSPDEQVLSGITRENIINICKETKYDIVLESIRYSELSQIDAAFITGTSPKVLPIKSIDNFTFNLPNPLIKDISSNYDELILSYLSSHQKKG